MLRDIISQTNPYRKPAILLTIVGIAAPNFIFQWYSLIHGANKASIVTETATSAQNQVAATLIGTLIEFAFVQSASTIFVNFLNVVSYIGLIYMVATAITSPQRPTPVQAFRHSLVTLLPRLPMIIVALGLIVLIGVTMALPAVIIVSLSIMAPVLLILRPQPTMKIFYSAVSLEYVKDNKLRAFANVSAMGIICYFLIIGEYMVSDSLANIDHFLDMARIEWFVSLGSAPIPGLVIIKMALDSLWSGLIALCLAIATTYYGKFLMDQHNQTPQPPTQTN